jgi:hypothetical protein
MALTKVTTGVVKDVVNSSSNITVGSINSVGIITATSFVGSGVGLTGITGGASQVYDSTVFAYQNVVESDITVALPYKTATIYTDPDVTVDIESGVQMSINDGCVLNIIDI